jgi:hypothetical protein
MPTEVGLGIAQSDVGDLPRQHAVLPLELLEDLLVLPQLVDRGTHYGL